MTLPSAAKQVSRVPVNIDDPEDDTTYFTGAYIERHIDPPPAPIPQGTARGGATFESEIRWAIDCLQRGDVALALNRLKRIVSR